MWSPAGTATRAQHAVGKIDLGFVTVNVGVPAGGIGFADHDHAGRACRLTLRRIESVPVVRDGNRFLPGLVRQGQRR